MKNKAGIFLILIFCILFFAGCGKLNTQEESLESEDAQLAFEILQAMEGYYNYPPEKMLAVIGDTNGERCEIEIPEYFWKYRGMEKVTEDEMLTSEREDFLFLRQNIARNAGWNYIWLLAGWETMESDFQDFTNCKIVNEWYKDSYVKEEDLTQAERTKRFQGLTYEDTKNILFYQDELVYQYKFENADIYYCPQSAKFLVNNRTKQQEFFWTTDTSKTPDFEFAIGSFLSNGRKQIVFHPVIGTGTGVLMEELHVVDLESLKEYELQDFVKEAEPFVEDDQAIVGAYQYYQIENNRIYVNLNVSIRTEEELETFRAILEENGETLCAKDWVFEE